ncbi:TetR/AcrR family transcriptional regulator [Schaalia sp. Marseille-Q2122]|uniref:TetR/AcrR family transcriptional regulator n=1 Tax=Schaalia sp. Marseille-Q2122 TaxID=2736604 RepID=UPI00158E0F81|nr:TetR/AcrR family transcriptional regulator [Schaalia sp. Marseille-Q2122]
MTTDTTTPAPQISQRLHKVRKLQEQEASERRADTQRRLIEAGRHIIAEHGVGGTSVNLITSRAGFTRGAFYSNFTDMDHFVRMVIRNEWKRTLSRAYAALRGEARAERGAGPFDEATSDPLQSIPDYVNSAKVTAGLHAATEGFFASIESEGAADDKARFTDVATRLLAALPQDRETLLLWTSVSNYLVRCADPSHPTIVAFHEFRHGISVFIDEALERLGLTCVISTHDLLDLVVAVGLRSIRNELIALDGTRSVLTGRDLQSSLTDRLFSVILPLLVERTAAS